MGVGSKRIDKVKYYLSFIGWGRSGNSLTAALLDFHPNIYIKNEFTALQERFKSQDQLLRWILQRIEKKTQGRWQAWGGFTHDPFKGMTGGVPLVIGGKKGGGTSNSLMNNPELFTKIYDDVIKIPVKWIHVQRNPYDNITTFTKHNWKPDGAIDIYFKQAESVKKVLSSRDSITVRLENLIKNPKVEVKRMCDHLGVDVTGNYLKHCKNVVWNKPRKTRFSVNWWTKERKDLVKQKIEEFDFMGGYKF